MYSTGNQAAVCQVPDLDRELSALEARACADDLTSVRAETVRAPNAVVLFTMRRREPLTRVVHARPGQNLDNREDGHSRTHNVAGEWKTVVRDCETNQVFLCMAILRATSAIDEQLPRT